MTDYEIALVLLVRQGGVDATDAVNRALANLLLEPGGTANRLANAPPGGAQILRRPTIIMTRPAARRTLTSEQRAANYATHQPRTSGSSLFDEECTVCGAKDYATGPNELTDRPCPGTALAGIIAPFAPRADRGTCTVCGGNDADVPCAYPSAGQPGCLRDARLKETSK